MAPYSLMSGALTKTHLCFVDDLVIFTRGLHRNLQSLFSFLSSYERVSGQRINKDKSSFYISKRCPVSRGRVIMQLVGIKRSELPLSYLRCTLFAGHKK